MDETDEVLLLLLLLHRRRRLKIKRCCWVKDLYKCRRQQGHFHSLIQEMRLSDEEMHFNYFRMSKQQMDKLLHLVGPHLEPRRTNWRNDCLSAAERLCLTIRFLATGDSYSSMSYAFRCAPSTVSVVIKATTQILWKKLKGTYMPPVTTRGWTAIAQQFLEKRNFPNCCGAIDGKHVTVKCPGNTSSEHFNYKESFSILFLALSDADYRFISVDVGTKGKDSDRGIFRESALGNAIMNGKINFPLPAKPLGSEVELPYVLVANETFPLHTNIMRPFPSSSLEYTKLIFNYSLKRARMVIENAFGVLCTRWRIFDRVLEM